MKQNNFLSIEWRVKMRRAKFLGVLLLGCMSVAADAVTGESVFCPTLKAEVHDPTFSLSTTILDGDIYIKIEPYDPADVTVEVNGSSMNVHQYYFDDNYYYRVEKSGEYRIKVTNSEGKSFMRFFDVQVDEKPPTLELKRVYMDDAWYIHVKADDDYGIEDIRMADVGLTFNDEGDAGNYKVEQTGTYYFVVRDKMGNETKAEIYVDVDQEGDTPKLTLSKEYKDDSWYLVIEAMDYYGIKEVTVDGEKIEFDRTGGKVYLKVKKTNTFFVQVTNEDGHQSEAYLYIDSQAKLSIPPQITLTQEDDKKGTHIKIDIQDNSKILEVQVNEEKLSWEEKEGDLVLEYPIKKGDTYTVTVKDDEDNEVKDFINITQVKGPDVENHFAEFVIGQPNWSKDGKSQEALDVAPSLIDGRTYLPLRAVAHALGIEEKGLVWNAEANQVEIKDGTYEAIMKVDEKSIILNGESILADATAVKVQGRVMIPLTSVAKVFDYKNVQLEWKAETKAVRISYRVIAK